MEMVERLEGERLVLRRPRLDDAPRLYADLTSEPAVSRWLTWTPHGSVSETADVLESIDREWEAGTASTWVMLHRDDVDRPVGMFSAWSSDDGVELGYSLTPRLWGAGLMTEAVRLVTERLLEMPDVDRVWATCDIGHEASARVLTKAGFQREAVLPDHVVHPNIEPEARDSVLYAKVASSHG